MIWGLKPFFVIASILIGAALFLITAPRHPDEVECERKRKPSGWYMDTALDFSGEDSWLAYVYFTYKWLFAPRMEADCQVEEFFRGQDLQFGNKWDQSAETTGKASISAVGDLMIQHKLNTSNSVHLYDDIEAELFGADIIFGNLETPAHPARPSKRFPAFNMSAEATRIYLGMDRKKGFGVVSTANNHVLDQGEESLLATLDHLDELRVAHVGSSRSPDERDNGFPIIEANGIKVAFLAYTFSTNWRSVPESKEYEVNLVRLNKMRGDPDISLIERHIQTARERGADVVVLSLHWGHDYEFYPSRRIIDRGHRIADAGADIIIGHHPHVLGPMESYVPQNRGMGVPEVLIAYSLGNFIPDPNTTHFEFRTSFILNLTLAHTVKENKKQVWIDKVSYTPIWWYSRKKRGKRDYRLINIKKAVEYGEDSSQYPFLRRRDWREIRKAQNFIKERFKIQEN